MANPFTSVQVRVPSKNTFDLSHDVKFTQKMGQLTPVLLQEVIPGDVFNIQTETLIRFAPLVSPVMHNIRVFTHYFFVPNRIVWANWEDFISPDLSKDVPPSSPVLASGTTSFLNGSLADYFGIPTNTPMAREGISAIPFAAYQKIYNEYYRDQNLQDDVTVDLVNGVQDGSRYAKLIALRTRAWQHDYFTSALPFAQKGPAVNLPIAGEAQVYADRTTTFTFTGTPAPDLVNPAQKLTGSDIIGGSLYADLSEVSGTTINDLRTAMRLQEWFEKAARGGSRYVEQLKVHWNVNSSDKRLDRPEFLGGTRNPVIVSEVLQTSETAETPQASMAGHGISAGSGKRIRYYAEEHGYIIGIQSIMPSTAYQQGLPRHFNRRSWEDYAWPTFAHLGEQEILNQELYYNLVDGLNLDTFGYIPRYSEYRYTPSRVAGEFKSTLAFWHLGRIFASRPALNAQFIEASSGVSGGIRNDIFAVSTADNQNLWCHSYHKIFVNRSLPKYGTPAL